MTSPDDKSPNVCSNDELRGMIGSLADSLEHIMDDDKFPDHIDILKNSVMIRMSFIRSYDHLTPEVRVELRDKLEQIDKGYNNVLKLYCAMLGEAYKKG